jgi:hypothetical protein
MSDVTSPDPPGAPPSTGVGATPGGASPQATPTAAAPKGLAQQHVLWISVVALVLVLVATYFLVPPKSAPFIYEFF